ncbi:hypothetical protein BpHYR1_037248 [Brachionus plicatilis]|uniref:Uncharacterized protein n=1 Tax=Brachionus plicatilis TaxID=10195 RepID=A0A3M7QQ16_BRAPC|nr:hypothetical protein BpHYR1_037248 [Brachionus plicatilis]
MSGTQKIISVKRKVMVSMIKIKYKYIDFMILGLAQALRILVRFLKNDTGFGFDKFYFLCPQTSLTLIFLTNTRKCLITQPCF